MIVRVVIKLNQSYKHTSTSLLPSAVDLEYTANRSTGHPHNAVLVYPVELPMHPPIPPLSHINTRWPQRPPHLSPSRVRPSGVACPYCHDPSARSFIFASSRAHRSFHTSSSLVIFRLFMISTRHSFSRATRLFRMAAFYMTAHLELPSFGCPAS